MKQNLSISFSGVNMADTPSTTVSITKWYSEYDDYIKACQDFWVALTNERLSSLPPPPPLSE
jgi:hypothetical protein